MIIFIIAVLLVIGILLYREYIAAKKEEAKDLMHKTKLKEAEQRLLDLKMHGSVEEVNLKTAKLQLEIDKLKLKINKKEAKHV